MFATQTISYLGLGISSIRSFSYFVAGLEAELSKTNGKIRNGSITFIDEMGEIGGRAYSPRLSAIPTLLHNELQDLMPADEAFIRWLIDNQERIVSYIKANGGEAWLSSNYGTLVSLFSQKDNQTTAHTLWQEIHLPRAVYGLFLEDELAQATERYYQLGEKYGFNANISHVCGTLVNVTPSKNKDGRNVYNLTTKVGDSVKYIKSYQVSYNPGWLGRNEFPQFDNLPNYINGMTEIDEAGQTSFERLEKLVEDTLKRQECVTLIVLGAAESAADLWVWAANKPELAGRIKFVNISRKGEGDLRPAAIHSEKYYNEPYPAKYFTKDFHVAAGQADVAKLVEMYADELANVAEGYTRYDAVKTLEPRFYKVIEGLSFEERELFWTQAGRTIVQLGFFTSGETHHAKAQLGKNITFVKCDFNALEFNGHDFKFEGIVYKGDTIINCAGFKLYNPKLEPLKGLETAGIISFEKNSAVINFDPNRAAVNADPSHPGFNFYPNGKMLSGCRLPYSDRAKRFTAAQQPQIDLVAKKQAESMVEQFVAQNLVKEVQHKIVTVSAHL